MEKLHPKQITNELIELAKQEKVLNKQLRIYLDNNQWMQANNVKRKLIDLEKRREWLQSEYDSYHKTKLGQLLPDDPEIRNNVYRQLIEISLAADYQLQVIEDFRDTLSKLDIESADIFNEVIECANLAQKTASRLLQAKNLSEVLLDNEELLHSLHETTLNYIKTKTIGL